MSTYVHATQESHPDDPNSIQWLSGVVVPQVDAHSATRIVSASDGRPMHEIEVQDLARMQSRIGRWNGHLINAIAALLLSWHSRHFDAARIILS